MVDKMQKQNSDLNQKTTILKIQVTEITEEEAEHLRDNPEPYTIIQPVTVECGNRSAAETIWAWMVVKFTQFNAMTKSRSARFN